MDNVEFRMLLTVALLTLVLGLAAGAVLPGALAPTIAVGATPSSTLPA